MATYEISTQDLPLWMRRARRAFDWGIIICIAFSIVAAWPFLLQPGLPHTNGSENYVFRTADYAQAISEGRLYPRWSANVLGGYGAPIPSFVPPGAAYVPALIQFFFTDDPVLAVRIVYLLSITLAGSAMYAFVLRRAGASAGVLASALYVFSPYLSSIAPHALGDLPSVMSLMLLPALLWSIDRLLARNHAPDLLFIALISAGLLLTDPRHALMGFVLGVLYTIWFIWTQDRQARGHLVLVAFTLGVGISAFYWLPALAERNEVIWTITNAKQPLALTLESLLSLFRLPDPNELIYTPQLSLGLSLVIFTAASILTAIIYRTRASYHLFFLACGTSLLALAVWVMPDELWLLGPAVMCLSVAGSSILLWQDRVAVLYLPAVLVVAIGLSITSWFAPDWSDDFGSTDAVAQVQYEQLGYGVAVVPPGAPVPLTTSPTILPDQTLVNSFNSGTVRKIAVRTGVQVGFLAHWSHGDQFQVTVQSPGIVQILTSYFPGWSATLNGVAVPLHRDPTNGLINLDISAPASGELVVALGTTTVRTIAWLLAQAAFVVTVVVTLRRTRRTTDLYEELHLLNTTDARFVSVIVVVFGVCMLLFAASPSPFRIAARPGYGLQGSTTLHSRSEVGLETLAYRLDDTNFQPGGTISLSVYWRALRFLPANYRVQLSLIDSSNEARIAMTPLQHPGGYPTQRWLTNLYVRDFHRIEIPTDIPPGDYMLGIDVFNCTNVCTDQNRLTFFNDEGGNLGQTLLLPDTLRLSS